MEALVKGRDLYRWPLSAKRREGVHLALGDVQFSRPRNRRGDAADDKSSVDQPSDLLPAELVSAGWVGGLIFTSYRTGTAQLFKHRSQRRVTATDRRPGDPSVLTGDFSEWHIYFVRAGSIWRIDRTTLDGRADSRISRMAN